MPMIRVSVSDHFLVLHKDVVNTSGEVFYAMATAVTKSVVMMTRIAGDGQIFSLPLSAARQRKV